MKSIVRIHLSISRLRRVSNASTIALSSALLAGVMFSAPAMAAVEAGTQPKDWPANPAKHKVVVTREATDDKQSAMITAAESAQVPKEELNKAAGKESRITPLPEGGKGWWYKEELGIRIPYAITGDAVAYYSEVVASNGRKVFKNRYSEPASSLDYHVAVKFHKELKLNGKIFKDVHVVTLKLAFDMWCAGSDATAGMDFVKQRIVVLDAGGKVLHISGDGPTEVPIRMM